MRGGGAAQDLRSDRQPEFTQLDLEMAFMDQDAVLALSERLIAAVFREVPPSRPHPPPLPAHPHGLQKLAGLAGRDAQAEPACRTPVCWLQYASVRASATIITWLAPIRNGTRFNLIAALQHL